jgi:predicted nucleotidyltransferase
VNFVHRPSGVAIECAQGIEGQPAAPATCVAWLYGSVARGTDEPRSDLDLALVLATDSVDASRQVRDAMQVLGDRLGVHISPVVLTPTDLVKLPPSDRWWSEVLREAKVLKGVAPAREAARCAKAQPA